jgi:hypothetical protein
MWWKQVGFYNCIIGGCGRHSKKANSSIVTQLFYLTLQ